MRLRKRPDRLDGKCVPCLTCHFFSPISRLRCKSAPPFPTLSLVSLSRLRVQPRLDLGFRRRSFWAIHFLGSNIVHRIAPDFVRLNRLSGKLSLLCVICQKRRSSSPTFSPSCVTFKPVFLSHFTNSGVDAVNDSESPEKYVIVIPVFMLPISYLLAECLGRCSHYLKGY
jgi:hypothetical protein